MQSSHGVVWKFNCPILTAAVSFAYTFFCWLFHSYIWIRECVHCICTTDFVPGIVYLTINLSFAATHTDILNCDRRRRRALVLAAIVIHTFRSISWCMSAANVMYLIYAWPKMNTIRKMDLYLEMNSDILVFGRNQKSRAFLRIVNDCDVRRQINNFTMCVYWNR